MRIMIGVTNSDKRDLHKTYTLSAPIECTVKDNCSVVTPVFVMKYGTVVARSNYLYAPDFGRYYFIEDIVMMTGGRAEVHCTVDVLESFQTQIENLNVNVLRNANSSGRNPYISDSNKPIETKTAVDTYVFNGQPFVPNDDAGNYVLTVMGGAINVSQ